MGFDLLCIKRWPVVTGGLLWQWIGGHLPGCGGGGGLGVESWFLMWCIGVRLSVVT